MKIERLLGEYKDWDGEYNEQENHIISQTKLALWEMPEILGDKRENSATHRWQTPYPIPTVYFIDKNKCLSLP